MTEESGQYVEPGPDEPIAGTAHTVQTVNDMADALREVDALAPSCPVATWNTLFELIGLGGGVAPDMPL